MEIADLIRAEVVAIPEKQPIIGSSIFTTQAGLHQTGIQRQSQAPGGLIYLPYDPHIIGRKETEPNRIGSLSGMDGIASLLNRYREASGSQEPRLTSVSRMVKHIYDHVHEAYNGRYDETHDRYIDYRTTFFNMDDLARLAAQFQNGQPETP